MNKRTTRLTAISETDELMTGYEKYNMIGDQPQSMTNLWNRVRSMDRKIILTFKGLKRNWSCIEKAILAQSIIGAGDVIIGACEVMNNERTGTYGYYYNPPFEFHSWVQFNQDFLVDFALPGVIEQGLKTRDEIGYILTDIEPVILCGTPPEWLHYQWHRTLPKDEIALLAMKFFVDKNND